MLGASLTYKQRLGYWSISLIVLCLPFVKILIKSREWDTTASLCVFVISFRIAMLAWNVLRRKDRTKLLAEAELNVDMLISSICLFSL